MAITNATGFMMAEAILAHLNIHYFSSLSFLPLLEFSGSLHSLNCFEIFFLSVSLCQSVCLSLLVRFAQLSLLLQWSPLLSSAALYTVDVAKRC